MVTRMDIERRLIEDSLPLKILGEYAQREKPAISKTISGLHLWWARRPLTLSRAIIASSLLKAPNHSRERKELHELIKKSCSLDAGQNVRSYTRNGRPISYFSQTPELLELNKKIAEHANVEEYKFLDQFAGGGSLPFEALRLKLNVLSSDLNPVSYLIRELGLRLIPKYGLTKRVNPINNEEELVLNNLVNLVEKWGETIIDRAYEELKGFYEDDSLIYLWTKTCHCKTCGNEIPLYSFKYVEKGRKNIGIFLEVNEEEKTFRFKIREVDAEHPPTALLRDRRGVTCPFCKARTTTLDDVKEEGRNKTLGYKPICKISLDKDRNRKFTEMTIMDSEREKRTDRILKQKMNEVRRMSFIPNEPAPETGSGAKRGFSNSLYGYITYNTFFSSRQALFLGTLAEKIRECFDEIVEETKDEELSILIILLLSFSFDRVSMYNSILSTWHPGRKVIAPVFSSPTLKMTWDFAESNPFTPGSGSWESSIKTTVRAINNCIFILDSDFENSISSATNLQIEDERIDLIVTDPPYFDYIGYADLSDFFYVWLKRMVNNHFPKVFKTILTPKKDELILNRRDTEAEKLLEGKLLKAWKEASRVLKSNGLMVVMFTHKSTTAWEQLFQTLHKAGFYATATWPVLSELPTKLLQNRANVNTTLNVVCRKHLTNKQTTGTFKSVKSELTQKIREKCIDFWNLDMYGSDFFVASIGPAMEVFAKYNKVIRTNGTEITIGELIDFTREIVSDVVLEKLLAETAATLDHRSRIYVLWRWAYLSAITSADELLTFLKGVGGEREELERENRIQIDKSNIWFLGPLERENDLLWKNSDNWEVNLPLIDQLHIACILREKGSFQDYQDYLKHINVQTRLNHPFWTLTRSLVEILQPLQSSGKIKGRGGNRELDAYRKVLESIPSVEIKREGLKQSVKLNGFLNKGD